MNTTAIKPFGFLYFFTVIFERPSPAVASASIATTRSRACDQLVNGGSIGTVQYPLELRMTMELKVMSLSFASRAEYEETWL